MNIISSDVEMNKVLANNPGNLFYCCLNNYYKNLLKYVKIKRLIVYVNNV